MGPEGMIPSTKVFGTLPIFPTVDNNLSGGKDRMGVIKSSRVEMEKITFELLIKTGLKAKLQRATKYDLKPGQKIRLYREASNKMEGPFSIVSIFEKQVTVTDGRKWKQFNFS